MELSPKLKLIIFATSSYPIYLNNNDHNDHNDKHIKDPLSDLIPTCSHEIVALLNLEKKPPNTLRFIYFNMEAIHQILYDNDMVVNIDKKYFEENFSNYFYLAKLIEDKEDIVNYSFKADIIEDLNNQKNKGIFNDIIIAKILIKLIDNYLNSDEYIEEKEDSLNEIKEKCLNKLDEIQSSIKKYNLLYDRNNIENVILEKIYIDIIINVLLKSGKIEETSFLNNFVDELDLKNIELTESMMKELDNFFKVKENVEKYNILKLEDLFNETKINYYYNLFRFILKDSFYIYHIDFLFILRENILNILSEKNEIYKKLINNSIDKEKFEYVINFLTYSKFSIDKFVSKFENKTTEKNDSYFNKNSSNKELSSGVFSEEKATIIGQSNQSNSTYLTKLSDNTSKFFIEDTILDYNENSIDEIDELYILKFAGKNKHGIEDIKNKVEKQIIYLTDGTFLDLNEEVEDSKKSEESKKREENGEPSSNNDGFNLVGKIIGDNTLENRNFICSVKSEIGKLIVNEIYKDNIKERTDINTIQLNPTNTKYFDSINKISNNKEYIKTGLMGFLVNYYEKGLNSDDKEYFNDYMKVNFNAIKKITDNFYAFVSNNILDNGKNILVFYDNQNNFHTKTYVGSGKEKEKYSFNIGNNSLYLIDIDNNFKLLLCACKRYVPGFKNGILITKIEINPFKTYAPKLNDTFDFEVNCFCEIYQDKIKKFSYILVGGFEVDKRRGMVKLYKISYNEEDAKLEFIQDAIEDFDDFSGAINNIVKSKDNEKNIIISCYPGTEYKFNLPDNDNYIKILEGVL